MAKTYEEALAELKAAGGELLVREEFGYGDGNLAMQGTFLCRARLIEDAGNYAKIGLSVDAQVAGVAENAVSDVVTIGRTTP